jgi:hypothetical protein
MIFFSGFFATLTLGAALAKMELDIYASSAKSPRTATGEIYPVCVNHGAVRYLSSKEYENYEAWSAHFSLPMLPALFALITSRDFWRSVREASS